MVRFWSDVRTVTEIANNMCVVFGTAEAGMIGEWSLNDVLTDTSGNGFTLTNYNTATFTTALPGICGGGVTFKPPSGSLALMGCGM